MSPFTQEQIAYYERLGAWQERSLYAYFAHNVARYPDAVAVVDADNRQHFTAAAAKRLSWRQLAACVNGLAAALEARGMGSGDVVLVQLPNICELVALYLAIARLGAIISPVAVQFRARELAAIIERTAPKAYISTTHCKAFDHIAYFQQCFPAFPGQVLSITEHADHGETAKVLPSIETLLSAPAYQAIVDRPAPKVDANALFSVCWTSGTEGQPKGVPRTHNNWRCSGIAVSEGYGITEPETILLPFPLINTAAIGGALIPWLICGGKLVLHHPFDAALFIDQLDREQVSITAAAPALLGSLLASAAWRERLGHSTLKSMGTGAAPPSPRVLREFKQQLGIEVINMFGSNEGVLLCSDHRLMPNPEQRAKYFPRVGTASCPGVNRSTRWIRTRLIDPASGADIDRPGQVGELLVKGPSIFPGYYNRGRFDVSQFDQAGFFHTGDLFEIAEDEAGRPRFYKVVGREKDIIIRGGFNISPLELDNLLAEMADIQEAAVARYPCARLGERVCACIAPKPGKTITLEMIRTFLEDKGVARYKWPERLVLLDRLPRNITNKVLRRELSAMVAGDAAEMPEVRS